MGLRKLASAEGIRPEKLKRALAANHVVVLYHKNKPALLLGEGCSTKINTNIGVSLHSPFETEIAKLHAAVECGTDTLMDLSTVNTLHSLRTIIKHSSVPVGSVPIYNCSNSTNEDEFINAVAEHISLGASFVTLHAAITKRNLALSKKRVLPIVSRGGSFIAKYILKTGKENPLYKNFDYLLELMRGTGCAISLGDALRPGAISDAHDAAQLAELRTQSMLVKKCLQKKIPVFCEGPGHMSLDKIGKDVTLQKKLCYGVPYYTLGPLVTDIALGYDHISAAIGGALAAAAGVDFLCVVTPSEHLSLPTECDIREGVIATKLAAHAGDIVKLKKTSRDLSLSKARAALDWKRQLRFSLTKPNIKIKKGSPCSMCDKLCSIKTMNGLFKKRQ